MVRCMYTLLSDRLPDYFFLYPTNNLLAMNRCILSFIFLLIFSFALHAQSTITGTILDQNGSPIPGATVQLLDTQRGAITDTDGFFIFQKLEQPEYQLQISYVGYQTLIEKVVLKNATTIVEISLQTADYQIKPIEITGNWADENTPVTYTNIDKETIQKQNLGQDVPYLLRWSPSTVVTSDAGTGIGYTGIRIRGSDPSRVNVSINGIPFNDAESQGVFWVNMPDFASSVNDIQIQRGVGTSTNGAGAFGATINLNTNQINTSPFVEINNSIGSFGTLKHNINAGSGMINNKFTLDGRLSRITSDGYLDRASASLHSFYVSGAYLGEKQSLRLNVFSGKEITYQAWNGVPAQYINDEKLRTFNTAGTEKSAEDAYENEVDDYQQTHYQLLFNRTLNDNWHLNTALHYTRGLGFFEQYKAEEDLIDYLLTEDPAVQSDLVRRRWLDNHFYGATYALDFRPTDSNAQFTLGGAINQYKGAHYGEAIWSAADGDISDPPRYYDNDATKNDFNIYGKMNYQLTDKINGYVDLQYRRVGYEFLGFDNDGTNVTQDDQLNFFNPKLGLVFIPKNGQRFYASFGVANREPNRSDYTESTPADRPAHETLYNYELGYRLTGSRGFAGINGYLMDYNNQLVLTGQINDVGEYTRRNVKDSYRLGLELEGAVALTRALQLNGNLTLSQNKINAFTEFIDNWDYWFQDFENTPAEELDPVQFTNQLENTNLAFSPDIILGSELSYDFLSKINKQSLVVALLNKYVGEQFIDNTSNENTKLPGYFFSDLRLSYDISVKAFDQVRLTVLVRNLWDNKFSTNAWTYRYRSAGYDGRGDDPYTRLEDAGSSTYNLTGFYPQAGRNILVGLTVRF